MRKQSVLLGLGLLAVSGSAVWADVTVNGTNVKVSTTGAVSVQQAASPAASPVLVPAQVVTPVPVPVQVAAPQPDPSVIHWTALQGYVQKVDQQAKTVTLTLRGSQSVVTVSADPASVVLLKNGDTPISLQSVVPGDDVVVRRLM